MDKKIISTDKAPSAIGPYSQAVETGGMIFTSGMIPVIPETGEIVTGIEAQAKQALNNVKSLLEAAGSGMDKVIKTTVFIKDMNDFARVNAVYESFFDKEAGYPARSCVEVARLPKDVLIEMEAVALK
ncbi:MAG: RidA family protein [Lachnospiraceae bacterium]|nr:RidA family protein [Lachnospiraceae bacterium]